MLNNFNLNNKPEHKLNSVLIQELIKLYGVEVYFVLTDKYTLNGKAEDDESFSIFESFASLKTVCNSKGEAVAQKINVLLAETESYPNGLNFAFSNYGIVNDDTLEVFVSIDSLAFLDDEDNFKLYDNSEDMQTLQSSPKGDDVSVARYANHANFELLQNDPRLKLGSQYGSKAQTIQAKIEQVKETQVVDPRQIISNFIVFPNNKIFEITDCQLRVEGVTNTFVFRELSNVYKLSLKTYSVSSVSDVEGLDKLHGVQTLQDLGAVFDKRREHAEAIEEYNNSEVVVKECERPTLKQRAKIDDVFGLV